MSIYQPYFYIIQSTRNSVYYAGAKWGKDANPETFMIEGGYTTFSKTVNKLIRRYGLDSFIVRKIKLFQTAEEAYSYETRFLQKVNARKNPKFYNRHNNDGCMNPKELKHIMLEIYGVENAMFLQQFKDKMIKTNNERYGVDYTMQLEETKAKRKNTLKERYGVEHPLQNVDIMNKYNDSMVKNHGVTHPMHSEFIKEKRKTTVNEKFGVNHVFQSLEFKEKSKETNIKKYGAAHSSQNKNILNKRYETMLNTYGVKHNSQLESSKNRNRKIVKDKSERIQVQIIKVYKKKFNVKIQNGWHMKSDAYLDSLLEDLIITYGSL
jgi:hypothetical protein